LHVVTPTGMIHCPEKGNHDTAQPIRFPWIDLIVRTRGRSLHGAAASRRWSGIEHATG
jgi:hypothetical protein